MRFNPLALVFLTAASALAVAQNVQQAQPAAHTSAAPAARIGAITYATKPHETEGEHIFKQQCSRCHNAPDGFSPRISGTVVRHMRVRASLSKHDEEELMRFFNP